MPRATLPHTALLSLAAPAILHKQHNTPEACSTAQKQSSVSHAHAQLTLPADPRSLERCLLFWPRFQSHTSGRLAQGAQDAKREVGMSKIMLNAVCD